MARVHIKDVQGEQIFEYTQLSDTAKIVARQSVFEAEEKGIQRNIERVKNLGINARINDPHHISRIVGLINLVRKWKNSLSDFEKVIEGNLCHFLVDGRYVTYFPK
jgi:hypothetical protein